MFLTSPQKPSAWKRSCHGPTLPQESLEWRSCPQRKEEGCEGRMLKVPLAAELLPCGD